jgi:hypothetical protein
MNTVRRRAIFIVLTAVLSWALVLPVAASTVAPPLEAAPQVRASEEVPGDQSIPLSDQALTVLVWSMLIMGVGALVFWALYAFKRRVGGFPENPSWVAPITIVTSKELPDEGDFGDQVPSEQAHAEH